MATSTTADSLLVKAAHLAPLPPEAPGPDGVPPADKAGRIQLFPAGHFVARDGRPGCLKGVSATSFRLGPEDMVAVISRWKIRATPLVVDYEHQTQHSAENGQPAPAAGWITQLEAAGSGLYATVEWTARAREHIRAGEYRYISPTFSFDRKTGAVLELHSAALTNTPALDGMDAASAKLQALRRRKLRMETAISYCEGQPKEPLSVSVSRQSLPTATATFTDEDATMDKLLAALCVLLGLPNLNSPEQAAEALKKHLPQANLVALLQSKDDALTAAQAQLAEAKAAPPDPALYVTLSTFQAVQAEAATLRATVSRLEAEKAAAGLEEEIAAALKDGRLAAAAETWAHDLARSNPEALRAFLKAAPPVAALAGTQSGGNAPKDTSEGALEAEEAYVCAQLGMTHEEYINAKATEEK